MSDAIHLSLVSISSAVSEEKILRWFCNVSHLGWWTGRWMQYWKSASKQQFNQSLVPFCLGEQVQSDGESSHVPYGQNFLMKRLHVWNVNNITYMAGFSKPYFIRENVQENNRCCSRKWWKCKTPIMAMARHSLTWDPTGIFHFGQLLWKLWVNLNKLCYYDHWMVLFKNCVRFCQAPSYIDL